MRLRGPVSVSTSIASDLGRAALETLVTDSDSLVAFEEVANVDIGNREGWVHVTTTFPELVQARRAGAATVWLNDQAAAGDLESQGYIGAAIIDDFADAICAAPNGLTSAINDARLARWQAEAATGAEQLAVDVTAQAISNGNTNDDVDLPVSTSMTRQFCMQCGAEMPGRANFCRFCGEKLAPD
eukprot:CAMPEP_0174718664 /NCGR_PEP_ID=MMETSP1094-20130205/29625_1 /TAXON_ID=156173 /ORGANISM="Chrysochromulina brevifilum, Strain UTEX LB 985" /LENGTH=184 /DNA_ID=CAMNT_0015918821 /DNA_START=92 /DNA_END=646 /DNA_ORIENTATION=-